MDTQILVSNGHKLIELFTEKNLAPRAAIWVHANDMDVWKLWMLPHKSLTDQKEFYRILSEIISTHRADLGGIEASDVEIKTENNPAIKGLSMMFNVSGSAAINISQNMINGYYVPDGIILLMSR